MTVEVIEFRQLLEAGWRYLAGGHPRRAKRPGKDDLGGWVFLGSIGDVITQSTNAFSSGLPYLSGSWR